MAMKKNGKAPTVPEIMEAGAATFRERSASYGDNYKHFGKILMGLFPRGIHIDDAEGYNRLALVMLCTVKISRYCNNVQQGHKDSAHDLSVYAAMLEEMTH